MFVYLILLNRTTGSILFLSVYFFGRFCRNVFRTYNGRTCLLRTTLRNTCLGLLSFSG